MSRTLVTVAALVCAVAICARPSSASPSSQRSHMVALIYRTFGHGYAGRVAECIVDRETGHTFDPRAVSQTNDVGLMQIHWPTWARQGETWDAFRRRLSSPVANLRQAFAIYHPKPGVYSFLPAWSADRGCL